MNWVDGVVLAVLVVSALLACLRGLVREVLGLAAWGGAAFVAVNTGGMLEPFFAQLSSEPPVVSALALGSAFIVALLIFSVVAILIARLVRGSIFGGLDRLLGLFYGIVRGAALVVTAYIVVGLGIHADRWPPPVLHAASLPLAYDGASWVIRMLPEEYRPQLQAPPDAQPNAGNTAPANGSTPTHL
jgi:membrane protein required for colicin V production